MTNPTVFGAGGHSTGGAAQTWDTNTNYYGNVGLGRSPMETYVDVMPPTESETFQIIRVPGVISYLSWGVWDATLQGFPIDLTLSVRRNFLVEGALVLTIPAGTTGLLTNTSDSLTVSAGDSLDFAARADSSTETTVCYEGSFYCASARFDRTDTASAQLLATIGYNVIIPYGSTVFFNFLGILASPVDTHESHQQFFCSTAGTWGNMACHVSDNSLGPSTAGTTLVSRKNFSNGVMAISIPSTATGYFEDTSTTSDSVSFGDLLDYRFSTTAGAGQLTMNWIGAHFFATDATQCMIGGTPIQAQTFTSGDNEYSSLFGAGDASPASLLQIRATGLLPYALKASEFTNHLTASLGGTATFTLMKNGAATALTISSSEGTSGYFIALETPVPFAQGDTCTNQIAAGGSVGSSVTWAGAALLLTASV